MLILISSLTAVAFVTSHVDCEKDFQVLLNVCILLQLIQDHILPIVVSAFQEKKSDDCQDHLAVDVSGQLCYYLCRDVSNSIEISISWYFKLS